MKLGVAVFFAQAVAAHSLLRRLKGLGDLAPFGDVDDLPDSAELLTEFEQEASDASERPVTFDTYVVNLDRRPDRCQCMAKQLASAPQGVYRQSAVDQSVCNLPDDARTLYGNRNHTAEKSLFCSNYLIWQRAKRSRADFVVILEDDAILEPNFWPMIGDFMQCSNFDYVTVDSWKAGGGLALDRTDACSTRDMGERLYRPNPNKYLDYWGTQAQIIRASFLDTLLGKAKLRGMGPMDVWWMMNINDGRAFSWQPGLVKQASKGHAPPGCFDSVVTSDINPVFFQRNRTTAESPPRLQCMTPD